MTEYVVRNRVVGCNEEINIAVTNTFYLITHIKHTHHVLKKSVMI